MAKTRKLIAAAAASIAALSACSETELTDTALTDKVVEWQITNFSDSTLAKNHWANAALYKGMAVWALETDDDRIWEFLKGIGEDCDWDMPGRVYDADDLCIGQTYFALYEKYGDPDMIAKVRERVKFIMENPDDGPLLTPKGKYSRTRWGWCDALFMAPPVYAELAALDGDPEYLDFCWQEFTVTTDSLFSTEDHLYHRDLTLVNDREQNGEKVFWARGNGWVYAALAIMMETVPHDHPSYEYYRNLYLMMTDPIVRCQDENGSWHSGMYDPEHWNTPENSASGFFVYGLAWGVNHGLLTAPEYKDAALKGWHALRSYVHEDGKLGYVQAIGHDPAMTSPDETMPYGVGAFLLAASEIIRMAD